MVAKDVMQREVFAVQADQLVDEVVEMFVREHIHGVPVLGPAGELVGMVTQQDVFFSAATLGYAGHFVAAAAVQVAAVLLVAVALRRAILSP